MNQATKNELAELVMRWEGAPNFDFAMQKRQYVEIEDVEGEPVASCANTETRDIVCDALNLLAKIAEEEGVLR